MLGAVVVYVRAILHMARQPEDADYPHRLHGEDQQIVGGITDANHQDHRY
jgi:hypothetical protein